MALNLDLIKSKLNRLQNTDSRKDNTWKPTPGKHVIRIVPYKFNRENPFIELYFHYNINNRTYLSPKTHGNPDPIAEFADKLRATGDQDAYKQSRKFQPKLRTYVPVVVRGAESEGVKFWGFGKTVYEELLSVCADEDYGDITDVMSGRDITVEYISAEDAGTTYPKTTVRVKPKTSQLASDKDTIKALIENQVNINDIYPELSYDELKEVLEKWLGSGGEEEDDEPQPQAQTQTPTPKPEKTGLGLEESDSSNFDDELDSLFA